MKQDLKELHGIIEELTAVGLHPGDFKDAIDVAVQIQRNRILKKALIMEWHSSPQSGPEERSAIDGLAIANEEGFMEISRKLDELIIK